MHRNVSASVGRGLKERDGNISTHYEHKLKSRAELMFAKLSTPNEAGNLPNKHV